jgi:hypothetical protein
MPQQAKPLIKPCVTSLAQLSTFLLLKMAFWGEEIAKNLAEWMAIVSTFYVNRRSTRTSNFSVNFVVRFELFLCTVNI